MYEKSYCADGSSLREINHIQPTINEMSESIYENIGEPELGQVRMFKVTHQYSKLVCNATWKMFETVRESGHVPCWVKILHPNVAQGWLSGVLVNQYDPLSACNIAGIVL